VVPKQRIRRSRRVERGVSHTYPTRRYLTQADVSALAGVLLVLAGAIGIFLPTITALGASLLSACVLFFLAGERFVAAWERRFSDLSPTAGLTAVLYAGVGMCLLFEPWITLTGLALICGCLLAVAALSSLTLYLVFRELEGSQWLALEGSVALILSILVFLAWPMGDIVAFGIAIGFGILLFGVARLMALADTYGLTSEGDWRYRIGAWARTTLSKLRAPM